MTVLQVANIGDSLSEGSEPVALPGNFSFAQGGAGAWWELVAERISNIPGVGPRISSGFRSTALSDGTVAYAGSWTDTTANDLWNKAPYGLNKYSAAGTSATVTFTRPAYRTVVGFALYWVDYTSSGNWSYKIDSGSFTANGQTSTNTNLLKKFYVSGAVTSTVTIQAATTASVAAGVCPVGIEWFYLAPSTTTGFIWHNLALNGMGLVDIVGGNGKNNGDTLAWFDAVTLGTGSPITNTPNLAILMQQGRDVSMHASTSRWNTDLINFWTRTHTYGTPLFMNHFELSDPSEPNAAIAPGETGYVWATQTSFRDQLKTTAAARTPAVTVLDNYDRLASQGFGVTSGTTVTLSNSQNVALRAISFCWSQDNGHMLRVGHDSYAEAVYWFMRKNVLP